MKKSWFTIEQVRPHIYALAEFHHWEKVVSYLLIWKKEAILFDAGMGYGDIFQEVTKITRLPLKVLLTHAHWDHIGGVKEGVPTFVYNHDFEKNLLEKGFESKVIPELEDKTLFDRPFKSIRYKIKGIKNYSTLNDKQIVKTEDLAIQVIHTPGHTLGSVCYLIPDLNVIITGDTIYPGPLYGHLPESNIKAYAHSVSKIAYTINKQTLVLPGHNEVLCNANLIFKIDQAFKQIGKNALQIKEVKFSEFSIILKN